MPYGRPFGYPTRFRQPANGEYFQGSDCGSEPAPPEIVPPIINPPANDGGGYAGYPEPAYNDPYAYEPAAYDTDAYAAGYADGRAATPYYDSDPVQFAYTPAALPPRAPVVRPDPARASPAALILPRHARNALHQLIAKDGPPANSIPQMQNDSSEPTAHVDESTNGPSAS
jgi:hypothetical protein